MEKERMVFLLKEGAAALALALLCVAVLLHAMPTSLDMNAYGAALKLSQGIANTPALLLHQNTYSIMKPFLPSYANAGSNAAALSYISYFLTAPPLLLFFVVLMTYVTLRLWKFGRVEAAAAIMLVSLGALSPVFFPGNFPPIVFGLALSSAGMLLAAVSLRLRENVAASAAASVGAAIFLSAAAWVSPETVWIPASVLLAELAQNFRKIENIVSQTETLVRMCALVVPIIVAFLTGGIFTLSFNFSDMAGLVWFAPFAVGFAAIPLLFLYWDRGHELAVEFSALAVLAFFSSGTSAGVGAVLLALPCTYGIRSISQWKDFAPLLRVLVAALPLSIAVFGIAGAGGNIGQAFSYGVLAAGAFVVIALLFDWENGGIVRFGLILLLCASAVMVAIQSQPFRQEAMKELKGYSPMEPQLQGALLYIGNSSYPQGPNVAVFAPQDAVKLLAKRDMVFANEEECAKWLAGKPGELQVPDGTLAVLEPTVFMKMDSLLANSSKGWSLSIFGFLQTTTNSNGKVFGVYMAPDGTRIAAALDEEGMLLPEQVRLLDYYGRDAGGIPVGQIVPLVPGKPVNTTYSALVMPNREYGSTLLDIYSNPQDYPRQYENGTTMVVSVGQVY